MSVRPTRLEDWTIDLVRQLAACGIPENDWYDIKANLQGQAEHQRKVVAAFANTRGGFLVFGVTNDRQVLGVENPELSRDFGNKLAHGLTPTVATKFGAPLPVAPSSNVWVCEVPRSERGPHGVLVNEQWVFPRRTESGSNVSMNVEELRAAFKDTEFRRDKLTLLIAEVQHARQFASVVVNQAFRDGPARWARAIPAFEYTKIEPLLTETFGLWAANETEAGLVARLRDAMRAAEEERLMARGETGRVSGRRFGGGARHLVTVIDELLSLLTKARPNAAH